MGKAVVHDSKVFMKGQALPTSFYYNGIQRRIVKFSEILGLEETLETLEISSKFKM